jgi:hypothetical protein
MMNQTTRTTDSDIMQFATLAIGATANKMGVSATEVHNRLKRYGLIQSLLFDCYDTLHTESIEGVVWNVMEALKNWEQKEVKQ